MLLEELTRYKWVGGSSSGVTGASDPPHGLWAAEASGVFKPGLFKP